MNKYVFRYYFSSVRCVLAVLPHKLYNAERNRKFAAVRRQALPHSLIEINRFAQCSVLTVHHYSIKRIHQNQPGALHNRQPPPTLISHLWVQSMNMPIKCCHIWISYTWKKKRPKFSCIFPSGVYGDPECPVVLRPSQPHYEIVYGCQSVSRVRWPIIQCLMPVGAISPLYWVDYSHFVGDLLC